MPAPAPGAGNCDGSMLISIIVAMDRNRLIGAQGTMPWRLPADLRWFKKVTMGKPVVMGRKTYESIGKPLKGRRNVVLTRDRQYSAPGCVVVHSIEEAIHASENGEEVMIIGGAQLYRQFLPRSERIYLTRIEAAFEGDTYFPDFSEEQWQIVFDEQHEAGEHNRHPFRFQILERKEAVARDGA